MSPNSINKMVKFLAFITSATIIFAFTHPIKAETVFIKFFSGDIQYQDQSSVFTKIKQGLKIDSSCAVKIGNNSKIIIMTKDGLIVTMDKHGISKIDDVIKQKRVLKKQMNKLGRGYMDDANGGPTSVAGVRGDNIYEQNNIALKRDLYWEN